MMIPRLGRILPLAMSVLGVFDTIYVWHMNKLVSVFIGIATLYLIHLLCRNHTAIPPKDALFFLYMPVILILVILVVTYFIFF